MNIIYFDGQYLEKSSNCVNVEDRGYMFGDGVYEVVAILDGFAVDFKQHIDRLMHSLQEIEINTDYNNLRITLEIVKNELLRRNNVKNAYLYIQITRGVAKRLHTFEATCKPSLLMLINPLKVPSFPADPIECISLSDIRWHRRDIKTISLLGNVLLRQKAKEASSEEVWLYEPESRVVTECASRNCFIVDKDLSIKTHPADNYILSGVTRNTVINLAKKNGYKVIESAFTIDEAYEALEAFTTTSCTFVVPVVKLDGKVIGCGDAGSVTRKLEYMYYKYVQENMRNAALLQKCNVL